MIVWIAREVGGDLFPVHKQFGASDEFRAALKGVNGLSAILDSDDGTTNSVVYVPDSDTTTWTGINVGDKLPDAAIENAIADNLASRLGIDNPVFAWKIDSDTHADKAEELTARVDESTLQRP
jgi:hypothetical protein